MVASLPLIAKPGKIGLEVSMNQWLNPDQFNARPFWQQFLIILGIDTLIVLLITLLLRDSAQLSNLYFWSSIILFIIAVIPILTELGSSARIAGKAIRKGEKVGEQLKEKQPVFDRGARTTYAFGLAGLVTFILSFLLLTIT
jgi:hypothetical protein